MLLAGSILALVLLHACQKNLRFNEDPVADHALIIQFKPIVVMK